MSARKEAQQRLGRRRVRRVERPKDTVEVGARRLAEVDAHAVEDAPVAREYAPVLLFDLSQRAVEPRVALVDRIQRATVLAVTPEDFPVGSELLAAERLDERAPHGGSERVDDLAGRLERQDVVICQLVGPAALVVARVCAAAAQVRLSQPHDRRAALVFHHAVGRHALDEHVEVLVDVFPGGMVCEWRCS